MASPFSVQVRARVSGYMTSVYFSDGSLVEKDAKLFEIDPRMYRADRDRAIRTPADQGRRHPGDVSARG